MTSRNADPSRQGRILVARGRRGRWRALYSALAALGAWLSLAIDRAPTEGLVGVLAWLVVMVFCSLPTTRSVDCTSASRLAVVIRLVGDVRRGGDGPDRRRADSH